MGKNSSDLSTTIASSIRRLSLSLLLTGCLTSPAGAQVKTAEIVGHPSVNNEDRVTAKIKVKDDNERPVMGLQENNFSLTVDGKPFQFKNKDWKNPTSATPPPAWIIVLLDFSGSMKEKDKGGTTKLKGAINAIKEFNTALAKRGANTKIAIVPFGEPGPGCPGNPVTDKELNNFLDSGVMVQKYLDNLAKQIPCASTNIYTPLSTAVKFLDSSTDTRFHPKPDSNQPDPRLSIILLSDGYDDAPDEKKRWESLKSLLKGTDDITVHTLGYGLTPRQLQKKYGLSRIPTRKDLGVGRGKVREEEFVDRDKLAEIAKTTGGISEFSADAEKIAEKLKEFLDALLGEYEISYIQPNAERGSEHNVEVEVKTPTTGSAKSKPKNYIMPVFGRSLPRPTRALIFLSVLLALGIGGAVPYLIWAQYIKRQA